MEEDSKCSNDDGYLGRYNDRNSIFESLRVQVLPISRWIYWPLGGSGVHCEKAADMEETRSGSEAQVPTPRLFHDDVISLGCFMMMSPCTGCIKTCQMEVS